MSLYRIDYAPAAGKALRRIRDARLSDPIKRAIAKLATDPRPTGALKLVGEVDQWRVRVGDWRIVYRIDDGCVVVIVVRVALRRGA